MKLIQQSAEIWKQPEGEVGIYKQVEKAARLCYKSEDKMTKDSYKRFINMLSEKGHNSPLEHGTVYLKYPFVNSNDPLVKFYLENPYSCVNIGYKFNENEKWAYITTNYRVLKEAECEEDLKYLCEPTEYHAKRVSVHITTSRAISHELVRHKMLCVA